MSIRNLDSLLAPRSVALIGASTRAGSLGAILARNLVAGGFKGRLDFVHPRGATIEGITAHANVGALPDAPDLAVIATPPATIPGLIGELGRRGTKAAIVISAGVTPELRQQMLDAARPHLLRVQGPNCLGLLVPGIGLDASFAIGMPAAGDLALISQSGALVTAILDWAVGRGIGFSHVVSIGDMADVDFGDLLDYLAGDTRSRAILLYVEQVTQATKFMSAARRAARAKPVIAIKAGRHSEGAKAARSHTGALAGSDSAYDAAFRRAGILRVNELEDLFNAAEMLARVNRLEGERLMIVTNGGGAGVLAADRLADLGGRLAELPEETMAALSQVLPATWSHANPVDIIGDADASRYGAALEQLIAAPSADALLVMHCPVAVMRAVDAADAVIETRETARKAAGAKGTRVRPVLACWLGEASVEEARHRLSSSGIATFETPSDAVEGFMQLVRYRRAQDELMQTPPASPREAQSNEAAARAVIAGALADGRGLLDEIEAKQVLAAFAIPVVPTEAAEGAAEVERIAARMLGSTHAVVLKIRSRDITHKSDVGGVQLDIATPAAARAAAEAMLTRILAMQPGARIEGFTVQAMIQRPRAHELLLGLSEDATFGPMLTFGAGGTSVEVVRDTVQALPPLDLKLAGDMIEKTRIARLLRGYRDRPAAALDGIALALVRLSALAVALPEVRELDINPLLADENGVIALDARIRVADATAAPRKALAIRPYPREWVRRENLPRVGTVLVRPIRPEDEALYDHFLSRVRPEDLRMRFFVARPDLSHRFIARLTQIDYAREMAFVVIDEAAGRLLGVARLAADPDYTRAEYAVLVASDLKGRGLGWHLMQRLMEYARSEGLAELNGEVLVENLTMIRMCRELGFRIEPIADDATVVRVVARL